MHPVVQIESLKNLPPSLRHIATMSCNDKRSLEKLQRARDAMDSRNLTPSQRIAFLPLFFAHLDPADIPTSAELETFGPELQTTVARVVLSLDAAFHIRPSRDAGSSLWSRVWPWFWFLHDHHEQLADKVELTSAVIFYTDFILFAGTFHDDEPTSEIMLATPGFRAILVKALSLLPKVDEPNRLEIVLNDLCGFLIDGGARDRQHLVEMVESAGGDIGNLASVCVLYLKTVLGRYLPRSARARSANVYLIHGLLSFIADADLYPTDAKDWIKVPLGPLSGALPFHDFVEEPVAAVISISTSPTPEPPETETGRTLNECLQLLDRILTESPGYTWLEEALDFGLIRIIVTCATMKCSRKINHHLTFLLQHIIPNGLIYYYTILQLKTSLEKVRELVAADAFRQCVIFEAWERFASLADDRVKLLDKFDTPDFPLSRGCDNLECAYIEEKWTFQRCSGCQAFYYCSKSCQISDWKEGGHRRACSSYHYLTLGEGARPNLVYRERNFLRALVHHDYEQDFLTTCAKQVEFMAANPDCEFIITLFSYCRGPVEIDIHSGTHSTLASALGSVGLEWEDIVARAKRSDGLLQIHVAQVLQGMNVRTWVVPLRSESSEMFQRLQSLAESPPAHEDLMQEIDFISADVELTEIH